MRLGVDFGTTRTIVAGADRGNYPVVSFEDPRGDAREFVPSLIALEDGRPVFGFRAEEAARAGAPHLRSVKRILSDPRVTAAATVRLGGRDLRVLDLVAGLLREVAGYLRTSSSVAEDLADAPLDVVVGVPAHAHSAQRLLTLEACRAAGFTVRAMVNEPSAAGFEYTHRHAGTVNSRRGRVLVFDLGGGTFDASLVAVHGTAHEVLGSCGDNHLGGDDFDEVLARCALRAAGISSAELGESGWAGLLDEARTAKESLSSQSRLIAIEVAGRAVTVPVGEFYEDAAPLVRSALATMEPLTVPDRDGSPALPDDAAGLYVVGGGSELPIVSRLLRSRFGRRVHRSPHAAASTAIGLAIAADPDAGYTLSERLSRGLGVFRESESGRRVSFDPLLEPDLRVSASDTVAVTRTYRAAHNIGWFRFVEYASADDEGVPRGDVMPRGRIAMPFDPLLQEGSRRGEVDLAGQEVVRTEYGPLVEERYSVDPNGIVEVQIRDCDTGFTLRQSLAAD
jgi:molecular chaperone DnaK (HSP70)